MKNILFSILGGILGTALAMALVFGYKKLTESQIVETTVMSETVETPKESLTLEELQSIKLPESYCISVYKGDVLWARGYAKFPANSSWEMLMGRLSDVKPNTLKVESSGIEDGMIYTLCSATLYGDTPVEFLFINDPNTLQYVACSETTSNYADYTHYLYYY